ncbi:hypothetical protein [Fulvimonas yonginensis]|uniref:EF-hand domain-containing protein n=1 Tax=Fulvimonas yonginensis TaxID=1495200 RepID=A0ABU8JFE2_9GAMM
MKTQRSLTTTSSALALLLGMAVLPTASAQQAGRTVDSDFQSMDQNHDGHLARSELQGNMALLRSRFTTYDSNQDGYLDPQEFATAKAALQGGGRAMESQTPAAPKPHSSANPGG